MKLWLLAVVFLVTLIAAIAFLGHAVKIACEHGDQQACNLM